MVEKSALPLCILEMARLLSVSPRTVRRLVESGALPAVRVGATLAIPLDGLPEELHACFDHSNPEALLTLHQVAARLRCSPGDVRERTTNGALNSVRVGGSTRWSAAEVARVAPVEDGA